VITRAATRSVIWSSGSSYFGRPGSPGCAFDAFARNDSGSFARAVALGRGPAYRKYLPPELALVRRLLTNSQEDRSFHTVLESRCGAVC